MKNFKKLTLLALAVSMSFFNPHTLNAMDEGYRSSSSFDSDDNTDNESSSENKSSEPSDDTTASESSPSSSNKETIQRHKSVPNEEIMREVYVPKKKQLSMPGLITQNIQDAIKEAILKNNINELKKLINKKTCNIALDDYENTPLIFACKNKVIDTVRFLLNDDRNPNIKFKTEIDKKNYFGETALHIAAENGDLKIVQLLIGHGSSLTSKCNNHKLQQTPLHRAVAGRSLGVIEKLVALMEEKKLYKGILQPDSIGNTVLHEAAGLGQYEATKFLAETFVNAENQEFSFFKTKLSDIVNMRNKNSGATPLICVTDESRKSGTIEGGVMIEREKIAQFLIQNGAKINNTNKQGQTALDLAIKNNHEGLIEILEKY